MTEMELACQKFGELLQEQMERISHMNQEKTDFSTKPVVTIGLIDGDGIGPIIMEQATQVLHKLLEKEIAQGSVVCKKIEGLTIENRLALGESVPKQVLEEIKSCDVLLKGPTTTPMGGDHGKRQCDAPPGAGFVRQCPPGVHPGGGNRLDFLPGEHGR